MKKLFTTLLCLLLYTGITHAQQITTDPEPTTPDFETWTEEQLQEWEEEVIRELYPEPTIGYNHDIILEPLPEDTISKNRPIDFKNPHTPNTHTIDTTKDVGEIPMTSSVTPTGAMVYTVPIEVAPGKQGAQPQLSVTYNSLAGNGVMGVGWNITGLSSITRVGKSIYYDGKSQGVVMTKDDAFALDGMRLIKLSETSTQINYETEQGNIKVTAHISGTVVRYFEVSYPNGNKGVFGNTSNWSNHLSFPLTKLTDLRDNAITYSYISESNRYYIHSISYTGASVIFTYTTTKPDPVVFYEGGWKVSDHKLLKKIECLSDNTTLRTYEFTYKTQHPQEVSTLTMIGCTAGNKSLNPLLFNYGQGYKEYTFTQKEIQLYEFYINKEPGELIVSRGKFDYGSDNDGIICLPYKNPYWQHYRNSTLFRRSENRYDNYYKGDEKIYLYRDLHNSSSSPMPNLLTEKGFTDIFTANIDGKTEEEIIKVNNTVAGSNDCLQFQVYSVISGLTLRYNRVFNFPTVLIDKNDNKSIHPKFHFTGDFNGDGRMEILSISNNHPLGKTDKPGKCYLFDLEKNVKLYEGTPFTYNKEFVGSKQKDPVKAEQNSDRLFVFDYDGDGKTDICLINDNGTYIYTFEVSGSTYSVKQASLYTSLKKSTIEGRELHIGEFNGDGKPDFLLTCKTTTSDWAIYYSMGNGQFDKVTTNITSRYDTTRFILQDVNGDGLSDLIKTIGNTSFITYITMPGNTFANNLLTYFNFRSIGAILVPTNINSHNNHSQLLTLKNFTITRYSFPRNDAKEKLLTGSVNSFGVVSKNHYNTLNTSTYYYSKGRGSTYPYENFQGPFLVPVSREQYVNGNRNEHIEYRYYNAVIHKQGRGFCGFEKVTTIDKTREREYTQEYDPYNFCVLKKGDTPATRTTNTWSISVQTNKIARLKLTNSSLLDKLTNKTVTSVYTHDTYGNVTKETIDYGGGVTKVTDQSYYNSTSGTIYMIGQPTEKTITSTRAGSSWKDRQVFTYNDNRLPLTQITYTGTNGDNKTGETRWMYDTNWNIISEKSAPYNQTTFTGSTYTYDTAGKYLLSVTNDLSQTTTYSEYNPYGNPQTIKDHKNRITTKNYDVWGRVNTTITADGMTESTTFSWGGKGLYTITNTLTGKPGEIIHYDPLGRPIRSANQRFDGQWQYVDTEYNPQGQVSRTSLPFRGTSPTQWNSYAHDPYDRPTKLTLASGKVTTWTYSGLSTTETNNDIPSTKTIDTSGALVSVTDPGGTIKYTLRPDGQPATITAPGGVITSMEYDEFGRQTALVDPSAGRQTTSYSYNTAGDLTVSQTNPEGTNISVYDTYNRITSLNRVGEFTTTYAYNADGLLASETSTNGTSKVYTYDAFDRISTVKETVPDSKWLQKMYTYGIGNLASIQYSTQSGTLATENFIYANGHHSETKLNGSNSIWKLTGENELGQHTAALTGIINRSYTYDPFGTPTARAAGTIQNYTYNFDVQKSNLLSRVDNIHGKTETFAYDNLNRLTNAGGTAISYTDNGSITQIQGVGSLFYADFDNPYWLTHLSPEGNAVPLRDQEVSYTTFQRPSRIDENSLSASFTYNGSGDRVKMYIANGTTPGLTRYYIGGRYELDALTNTERLYLDGDAYTAPAVYVKEGGNWKIYYICRDYLGSITHIAHSDGTLKQELSYDAWGRLRNPSTHVTYKPDSEPALFLGRGYTGHEHLTSFGLVNMNARLYDPALGRFLSPDPYVQMPDFTQNFNRYSYALNNPLKYIDKNGEFIEWIIIGFAAGISAYQGYTTAEAKGYDLGNWQTLGLYAWRCCYWCSKCLFRNRDRCRRWNND